MQKIVLASNNQGKVDEFNNFFADLPVKFIPQSQFSLASVPETACTFIENALIKARYAAEHTNLPALADDSGLMIDALGGAPGIHTARYAGEQGNFEKNIAKVLNEMQGVPMEKRTARVQCILAFIKHDQDPLPIICHGVWECLISEQPRGDKGFGFDPLIYLPEYGLTAGEMEPAEKNSISHRAKAIKIFLEKFQPRLGLIEKV